MCYSIDLQYFRRGVGATAIPVQRAKRLRSLFTRKYLFAAVRDEEIEGEKEQLVPLKARLYVPCALQKHLCNYQRLCTQHHVFDRVLSRLARGKAGGND